MHLIEDHTRQQDAADGSLIDSVQELHCLILPFAHPEEFADFVARNGPRQSQRRKGRETPEAYVYDLFICDGAVRSPGSSSITT